MNIEQMTKIASREFPEIKTYVNMMNNPAVSSFARMLGIKLKADDKVDAKDMARRLRLLAFELEKSVDQ